MGDFSTNDDNRKPGWLRHISFATTAHTSRYLQENVIPHSLSGLASMLDPGQLLEHERNGDKDGRNFIPGRLRFERGGKVAIRQAASVVEICALVIDLDSGTHWASLKARLERLGVLAYVTPTYSHLKTAMTANMPLVKWQELLANCGDSPTAAIMALGRVSKLHSVTAFGIDRPKVVIDGDKVALGWHWKQGVWHWRIVIPLAESWHGDGTKESAREWRQLYHVLVAGTGIWDYDPKCADAARLTYTARWCQLWRGIPVHTLPDGEPSPAEPLATFDGPLATIDGLTARAELSWEDRLGADEAAWRERCLIDQAEARVLLPQPKGRKGRKSSDQGRDMTEFFVSHPDTGETIDLTAWHYRWGEHLKLATDIESDHAEALDPDREWNGANLHIICPTQWMHGGTTGGGTFVRDGAEHPAVWVCMHAGCRHEDRSPGERLAILIEAELLSWEQLAEAEAAGREAELAAAAHLFKDPVELGDDPDAGAQAAPQGGGGGGGSTTPPPDDDPPEPAPEPAPKPKNRLAWDPWEVPVPPTWPGGILRPDLETELTVYAERNRLDYGALCMTALAGVSVAAPKDAWFRPYGVDYPWAVPPIIWLMLVANSGFRKSALERVFSVIRDVMNKQWELYEAQVAFWEAATDADGNPIRKKDRGPKPAEPHALITEDATLEKLQAILARTTRGSAMLVDEMGTFLDFARHGNEASRRAFYLKAYDAAQHSVTRVMRGTIVIRNTGLPLWGSIQQDYLALMQELHLHTDGMMQRMLPLTVTTGELEEEEDPEPSDLPLVFALLQRLCGLHKGQTYQTSLGGTRLIRQTEAEAAGLAKLTHISPSWPGFCLKLHGLHARLALLLHFMENHEQPEISEDTVRRAGRLVWSFVMPHVMAFHETAANPNRSRMLEIAGWLMTKKPGKTEKFGDYGICEVILPSLIKQYVWSCRELDSKALLAALDPFILRGWLIPEEPHPLMNRRWFFQPGLRTQAGERVQEELDRRRAGLERLKQMRNRIT